MHNVTTTSNECEDSWHILYSFVSKEKVFYICLEYAIKICLRMLHSFVLDIPDLYLGFIKFRGKSRFFLIFILLQTYCSLTTIEVSISWIWMSVNFNEIKLTSLVKHSSDPQWPHVTGGHCSSQHWSQAIAPTYPDERLARGRAFSHCMSSIYIMNTWNWKQRETCELCIMDFMCLWKSTVI